MLLESYRNVLLTTIKKYEDNKGKRLSSRRKKDIDDLRNLLHDQTLSNPLELKLKLEARLAKISTGWWIFRTGNSQLRTAVRSILNAPHCSPQKILQAEVTAAQTNLIELQAQAQLLSQRIEAQNDKAIENTIHLKLQDLNMSRKPIYLSYEEYIIHLLNKFIRKQSLHHEEASQLIKLLSDGDSNWCNGKKKQLIAEKIGDACEFAFRAFVKDMDYLIKADQLQYPTFRCLVNYADFYCQAVKPELPKTYTRFAVAMTKLLQSYYQDGAGRTKVSGLSEADKNIVLDAKEALICQYGDPNLQHSIAPLCDLRKDSRWDEFKARCVEKGRYLFQWLKDKKSAAKIDRPNPQALKSEVMPNSASDAYNTFNL